jgi:transcriptional regulator with XRE-family HTH domain
VATGLPIGTRIKARRQQLGLTQVQLADAVGASESAVIDWELGRHFPRRKLHAIEAALGISLTGPPEPDSMERLAEDVSNSRDLSERQKQALLELIGRRDGQSGQ